MNDWLDALRTLDRSGEPVVAVTVAGVRGSAPREVGAKMLVTASETIGTIGGGQLEYECTRRATRLLGGDRTASLERFPLGSSMGQCCGGVVDICFERLDTQATWFRDLDVEYGARQPAVIVTDTSGGSSKSVVTAEAVHAKAPLPTSIVDAARAIIEAHADATVVDGFLLEPIVDSDFDIAVFGAGHVGSAVIATLSGLDCNVRWIDNRRDVFGATPADVHVIESPEPALEVAALKGESYVLVMTHSHAIDLDITARALERGDLAYCGLIGSRSKRRRFEKRLLAAGLSSAHLENLTCPIGIDGITGKKPAEIAIAVVAELLKVREARGAAVLPDNVHRLGKA